MDFITRYSDYPDEKKQLIELIFRVKELHLENLNEYAKRIIRYKAALKEDSLQNYTSFLIEDGWCRTEENTIILNESDSATQEFMDKSIQENREKWRTTMIDEVCEYVGLPDQHPLRKILVKIDRKHFIPEKMEAVADIDRPVPLKKGMTESALHAVLLTIKPLEPKKGDKVLICGAKGGYLSALMAELVGEKGKVLALDWDEKIIEHCKNALKRSETKLKNIEFRHCEDVTVGVSSERDWDCIVVNGSIPKIPYELMHNLNDENGRILFFIANYEGTSQCFVVQKNQSIVREEKLSKFRYTPIPGKYGYDEIKSLQDQYEIAKSNWKNNDVEAIKNTAPYPISKSFFSACNSRDFREKYDKVIKIGEALIKYFALIGIAHETQSERKDLGPILKKITNAASYGTWWAATRDLLSKSNTSSQIMSELLADWKRSYKSKTIIKGYNALADKLSIQKKEQNAKVELDDFLIKLVEYRNAFSGHGYTPPESHAREIADILTEVFTEILSDIKVFKKYELIACAGVNGIKNNAKQIINEVDVLIGLNHEKRQINISDTEMKYWMNPYIVIMEKGSKIPILDLNPWMIWTDKGSNPDFECYIFNSRKNNECKYTTYHNTSEFPDTRIKEDFDMLLNKFPDERNDQHPSMKAFRKMLDIFLKDRILDPDELNDLIEYCFEEKITGTKNEAKEFIYELIATDYPGTHITE